MCGVEKYVDKTIYTQMQYYVEKIMLHTNTSTHFGAKTEVRLFLDLMRVNQKNKIQLHFYK